MISYRVPAFRVGGKTVAGFAAFTDHLSYLPFSGSVNPDAVRAVVGTASRGPQPTPGLDELRRALTRAGVPGFVDAIRAQG